MLKMNSSETNDFRVVEIPAPERERKWGFCCQDWSHQDCGIWLANVLYFEWGLTRALCETVMWFCRRYLPYSLYVISKRIGPVVKNNMLRMKYRFIVTQESYLWSWFYEFHNPIFKRVSEKGRSYGYRPVNYTPWWGRYADIPSPKKASPYRCLEQ